MNDPDEWRHRYERLRGDAIFIAIGAFTAGFVLGSIILKLVRD